MFSQDHLFLYFCLFHLVFFSWIQEKSLWDVPHVFPLEKLVHVFESNSCPPAMTQPVLLIHGHATSRTIECESSGPEKFRTSSSSSSSHRHSNELTSNSCNLEQFESLSRLFVEMQHSIRELMRSIELNVSLLLSVCLVFFLSPKLHSILYSNASSCYFMLLYTTSACFCLEFCISITCW